MENTCSTEWVVTIVTVTPHLENVRMNALVTPRQRPDAAEGPRLRLLEGGRSAGALRMRRLYWRRRLAVVASAVVFIWLVASSLAGLGGSAVSGSSGPTLQPGRYVAHPGDTLWGIARRLDRGGDIRDVVDRLAEVNHSDTVVSGQNVVIPSDLTD